MSRRRRRRGKAILIFTHGWRISAARFIKEQSPQRGHKLSSEVFTIITISSLPTPPALSFLLPYHSPLFTSEITCHSSALLKSTFSCSGTFLQVLSLWASLLRYWTDFFSFTTSACSIQYFIPTDINPIGSWRPVELVYKRQNDPPVPLLCW